MKSIDQVLWSRTKKDEDCLLFTGCILSTGYGGVWYLGKRYSTHRLSWIVSKGPILEGKSVLHKCDRRNCINPDHLFLGYQADNMLDMKKKGRDNGFFKTNRPIGSKHYNSKLNERDVLEIRSLRKLMSSRKIAEKYGVSKGAIAAILVRRNWPHV